MKVFGYILCIISTVCFFPAVYFAAKVIEEHAGTDGLWAAGLLLVYYVTAKLGFAFWKHGE